jgi:hypothetical protein
VAAQDQSISTNYFKNNILKEEVKCKQHEETMEHLTSGCPILAKNEYLMRHDKVSAHFTANRPDIIITNKKEKKCTLIDVAIPADKNVPQKEAEKKLRYKSLCTEIQ